MRLILGSQSPRRQALLRRCGYPFETISATVDEAAITARWREAHPTWHPEAGADLALHLAQAKADAILPQLLPNPNPYLLITADTLVLLGDRILGKPRDATDARTMLRTLAGQTHQVVTGVTLHTPTYEEHFTQITSVTFAPLDPFVEAWIERTIERGSPFDKAGGYGIQEDGAFLVASIEGDYYNVVGFPLARIARAIDRILTLDRAEEA